MYFEHFGIRGMAILPKFAVVNHYQETTLYIGSHPHEFLILKYRF